MRHLGIPAIACFSFGPPPRLKGIIRLFMLETYSGRLADVGESRCNGLPDRKVLALLKDYVSVIRFLKHHVVRETQWRRSSLVGKSAQTSAECIN